MERFKANAKKPASIKHPTHKNVFIRFGLVLLVFIAYFLFISTKYGYAHGFIIAWLSWSFFVLCTPIADAGMLIDFPVRLITNIKMVYSEVAVWVTAISLNTFMLVHDPDVYSQTQLLQLFKHILTNPIPLWLIFFVSALGTFLSIQLGDELLDVIKHKDTTKAQMHDIKLRVLYMAFVLVLSFVLYDFLLTTFNFDIPF